MTENNDLVGFSPRYREEIDELTSWFKRRLTDFEGISLEVFDDFAEEKWPWKLKITVDVAFTYWLVCRRYELSNAQVKLALERALTTLGKFKEEKNDVGKG